MAEQPEKPKVDPATKALVQKVEPYLRQDRKQEAVQVVTALIQKSHQGPLPAPEDYGAYEQILPGAAERILTMAESNMGHRQAMERDWLEAERGLQSRGQILAIIALLAMLLLIGFTFWVHQPIAGFILGAGTIVAVVGMFLRTHHPEQKAEAQPEPKRKQPPKRKK